MHIYFTGVLLSTLIMIITVLIRYRKIQKTQDVFEITTGDIFFALICVSAAWVTVVVFITMCIKPEVEDYVIRRF